MSNTRGNNELLSIPGEAPSNPFGIPINLAFISSFPQEQNFVEANSAGANGSLSWDIDDNWELRFDFAGTKNKSESTRVNFLRRGQSAVNDGLDSLQLLLAGLRPDPANPGQTIEVPANELFFNDPALGFNSVEELVAAVVVDNESTINDGTTRDLSVNLRGSLGSLPGGDIQANFVLSHQRFTNSLVNTSSDPRLISRVLVGEGTEPVLPETIQPGDLNVVSELGTTTNAAGFEVAIPIIGDNNSLPLFNDFLINVNGRYEQYSHVDDQEFNWSAGFNWGLTEDFSIRLNRNYSVIVPKLLVHRRQLRMNLALC